MKPKIDRAEVRRLHAQGLSNREISRTLKCSHGAINEIVRGLTEPKVPPKPEVDPLTAARDARVTHAAESRDRVALRSALSRLEIVEERLEQVSAPFAQPLEAVKPVRLKIGQRQACAVALLSDVHAGAVVHPTAATFQNRYNPEICRYRLGRYFAGVEWLVQNARDGRAGYRWQVQDLLLAIMGDVIDGHLHEEQIELSEPSVLTISWLAPVLLAGIRRLQALGLRVRVVCSYGNHGRDTKKPRRATGAHHSYEWGMYQQLGRELQRDGIELLADPTAHQYIDVYGRTLHFHHGDEIKYQGGVGGITIPINKRVASWNEVRPSYLHHMGHFHQKIENRRWFANGCVVGYNDFAMSIGALPEEPTQTFYLLDEKRGVTSVSPIWVSDKSEESKL